MTRGATRQGGGVLLLAALATGLGVWPASHLGASSQQSPNPNVHLVFQAVGCDSWSKVPGNAPGVLLDDTNGHYREWGPPTPTPVAAYDASTIPAGCKFIDGVSVRVSGQENGVSLVPYATTYEQPGQEDGSTTTIVGKTGSSGPGRFELSSGDLTPQQQFALFNLGDGGGLWAGVVLPTLPGEFANLRCHRDAYNADNLEVIRPAPIDDTAVCVAYAVGAGFASQPTPPPSPAPQSQAPPSPAPQSPAPPGPAPGSAPSPAAPAVPPTTASTAPGPSPAAQVTAPAHSAPPSPTATTAPAPRGSSELALPAPPAQAAAPVAPAAPPVAAGPPTQLAPNTRAVPQTKLSVMVEVGGVTRGSSSTRAGAARSPWIRPVKVQLDCGEGLTREVSVPVGEVPGFSKESDPVVLPNAERMCMVRTEDAGVDLDTHRSDVSLKVDGSVLASGQWLRVTPQAGADKQVTVNVTFAVAKVEEPAPPVPQPGQPAGDHPLSPALTLTLVGVFAVGLAGAVLRSRRPF